MTIVVDASIALKWFIQESEFLEARALMRQANGFAAPDLIVAEVANAFWRKRCLGAVSTAQASEALEELLTEIDLLVPCGDLWRAALGASEELDHAIYDCFHLALAQSLDARMVAADRRLIAKVARSRFARLVTPLT
jgi:predicted nucleic acid-binding protein